MHFTVTTLHYVIKHHSSMHHAPLAVFLWSRCTVWRVIYSRL